MVLLGERGSSESPRRGTLDVWGDVSPGLTGLAVGYLKNKGTAVRKGPRHAPELLERGEGLSGVVSCSLG